MKHRYKILPSEKVKDFAQIFSYFLTFLTIFRTVMFYEHLLITVSELSLEY